MKRIAIFVSGSGTNMENIIRKIKQGELACEAAVVISDKPGVGALEKAGRYGVEALVVDRKQFNGREDFEAALIQEVDKRRIDIVVLAGFMRVLTPGFVEHYWGRLINIHPSLLPAFPGAHGILDAFNAKVKETGVTVHFVDTGVDTGPVILQRKVKVDSEDTLETLENKIHSVEYEIYPQAIKLVLEGKAKLPD